MAKTLKVCLSIALRYAICIGALVWIAIDTDWGRFSSVLAGADWRLAMLAVAAFGPAPVLIALRLKLLLAVQDVHLSLWQAIKVTFAGNFIINTLPVGTGGGDTLKAYYVARDTPYKHEAVTAVFFDRVIGVAGLLLMSGIIVLLDWGNPAFSRYGRPIGIAVLVLVLGGAMYYSRRVRLLLRLDDLLARLPLANHIQRIDRAAMLFRDHLRRMAACVALTAALQTISIVAYFLGGWALGVVGPRPWSAFPVYLAYTPICFLAGALPIGAMEVVFRELFAEAAGLGSPEAALSLSFFGRLMQLAWALPGAFVVLRSRPQATTPEQPMPLES